MKEKKTPWWETAVLVASFILVWAWFLTRGTKSAMVWNAVLLLAVVALVVVFVRRVRRTVAALRDQSSNFKDEPQSHGGTER
jgi:heme exporter protein D